MLSSVYFHIDFSSIACALFRFVILSYSTAIFVLISSLRSFSSSFFVFAILAPISFSTFKTLSFRPFYCASMTCFLSSIFCFNSDLNSCFANFLFSTNSWSSGSLRMISGCWVYAPMLLAYCYSVSKLSLFKMDDLHFFRVRLPLNYSFGEVADRQWGLTGLHFQGRLGRFPWVKLTHRALWCPR